MNISEKFVLVLMICFALAIGAGCATPKVWVSNPSIQNAVNDYYDANLEPLTQDNEFFVSFLFSVTNRTDKNLEIDWNKTRYIHNNKNRGVFVFKGIEPEDIKNSSVPFDIIPPGGSFSKRISPYKLIARAPLRENEKDSGINPGILPTGENGILLVVRQNSKEIVQKMMVHIMEKDVR